MQTCMCCREREKKVGRGGERGREREESPPPPAHTLFLRLSVSPSTSLKWVCASRGCAISHPLHSLTWSGGMRVCVCVCVEGGVAVVVHCGGWVRALEKSVCVTVWRTRSNRIHCFGRERNKCQLIWQDDWQLLHVFLGHRVSDSRFYRLVFLSFWIIHVWKWFYFNVLNTPVHAIIQFCSRKGLVAPHCLRPAGCSK